MAQKTTKRREIDKASEIGGAGTLPPLTATSDLGAPIPSIPAPEGLAIVSNLLAHSAVTPSAIVTLSWRPPSGFPATGYQLQYATDSGFTANVAILGVADASQNPSYSITLPTSQLWYFRVAAIIGQVQGSWSAAVSVTTAADTTAPAVPTGLAAAFNNAGDLEISWVNPTSTNLRDVEVSIYADSGFTQLRYQTFDATQRIVWTASQNRLAGSGTPDPTVFVRMRSRSWGGVFSATAVPSTQPVKAVPGNVSGLTQSWNADAGTAAADLLVTWTAATGAAFYRLTIDGVAHTTADVRYLFPFDQNRIEHSGTPDPVLSLSLVGVDGLDQVSATPATATATNAAPVAPTGVTLAAFFSTIVITVGSDLPADGLTYRFRLIQTLPSASDISWDALTKQQTRAISAAATYQIGVRAVDVFGQLSTETLSSTAAADAITLADLRANATYSDDLTTSPATLYAEYADGVLSSAGISYALSAGWTHFIRFSRVETDRYKTITLSKAAVSGSTFFYIRTSQDGVTWRYFGEPVTSLRILTERADLADAQGNPVTSASVGIAGNPRIDLPAIIPARYIEVWFRNTTAATLFYEFYPRRLVQSDDIEAEAIRAINILAGTITGDRIAAATIVGSNIAAGTITATNISVTNLSSLSANLGTVTAGTVTGATIQTATSGQRVVISGSNMTIYVPQTQSGLTPTAVSTYRLNFVGNVSGTFIGGLEGVHDTTSVSPSLGLVTLRSRAPSGEDTRLALEATATSSGNTAVIDLFATDGTNNTQVTIDADTGVEINGDTLVFGGVTSRRNDGSYQYTLDRTTAPARKYGLAIESGGGSLVLDDLTAGLRRMTLTTGGMFGFPAATTNVRVMIDGATTTAANYALYVRNSTPAVLMYVENNGTLWGNIAWTSSDERMKEDIRRVERNSVLERFRELQPSDYIRKMSGLRETGLIAQEVQAQFPDIVQQSSADDSLAISYSGLATYQIIATLELDREVRALRSEIQQLKEKRP